MKSYHLFFVKQLFLGTLFLYISHSAQAQTDTILTNYTTQTESKPLLETKQNSNRYSKNIFKVNVTSLSLKNYHFTYERMLSRKISVSGSYRIMPMSPLGSLSLVKTGLEVAGQNDAGGVIDDLNKISASNKAYTLEFRFYGGRKPGAKGFYTGLFGRYGDFKANYDYTFEDNNGKNYLIPIRATAQSISAGLQLGAQFTLAKHITVDLQLLGGHYGKMKGAAVGNADLSTLPNDEKRRLEQDIEDISPSVGEKKLFTIQAKANNSGLKADMKGPFAGVRAGINIGISF